MSWVQIPSPTPNILGPDRTHRLHFWAKRVVERLQSFFLQINVAEIVIHKADQPNTFFDLLDTDSLPREDSAEINFFAVETDTSAVGDVDGAVVKRIIKFRQAALFKQALKGGKSKSFTGRFEGFTEEEIARGVIRDGQRVAVFFVAQQELAFVIGAP